MSLDDTLYLTRQNSKTIILSGLTLLDDNGAATPQNAASLFATILTKEFVPVPGYENISMTFISGSQGNYLMHVDGSFSLEDGLYFLQINGTSNGATLNIVKKCVVLDRSS